MPRPSLSKHGEFHEPITGWRGHLYCAWCGVLWPCRVVQERIAEQPKEPKPTPRVDSPAEAFSRRDQVILRAPAALAVA